VACESEKYDNCYTNNLRIQQIYKSLEYLVRLQSVDSATTISICMYNIKPTLSWNFHGRTPPQ
jgi:hypothetical protein